MAESRNEDGLASIEYIYSKLKTEAVQAVTSALEDVYYEWWSHNEGAQSMGQCGDVFGLFLKLREAFEKTSKVLLSIPRADIKSDTS
jgi:hypothetical protein